MGLLETILTKRKPCGTQGTFSPLCLSHGFLHACLLRRNAARGMFVPVCFHAYDVQSAGKAQSSAAFWDGTVPRSGSETFPASDASYPFHQFFSETLDEEAQGTFCQHFSYKKSDFIFLAPLTDGCKATPFSDGDRASLADSIPYRRTQVSLMDVQDIPGLSLARIAVPGGTGVSRGSIAETALFCGLLGAAGTVSWLCGSYGPDGTLGEVRVLAAHNSGIGLTTVRFLLDETTERSLVSWEPVAGFFTE